MAISTNSIIHYTNTLNKLKGIIKEGFKIKYCLESLNSKVTSYKNAHPMISFCDIPLSESARHFGLYGHYGIGVTKNWAKKKGINPVLYIDKDSYIGMAIPAAGKAMKDANLATTDEIYKMVILTKCYSKNYSGPLKRGKIDTLNYKFYDEREWRLIPLKAEISNHSLSVKGSDYEKDKSSYNLKLSKFRFKFDHSDISYIIVNKTDEIPQMIEFLKTTFYKTLKIGELDILLSKVCSTEQIIEDY